MTPAPAVTSPATVSTGSRSRSRVSETTTWSRALGGRGTEPPTSPVLPPCGMTAAPVVDAGVDHRGDLLGIGWADDGCRLAVPAARPVGLVARTQVRIRQDVRVANGVAEIAQELLCWHAAHRATLALQCRVLIAVSDHRTRGHLEYRRHRSDDAWARQATRRLIDHSDTSAHAALVTRYVIPESDFREGQVAARIWQGARVLSGSRQDARAAAHAQPPHRHAAGARCTTCASASPTAATSAACTACRERSSVRTTRSCPARSC